VARPMIARETIQRLDGAVAARTVQWVRRCRYGALHGLPAPSFCGDVRGVAERDAFVDDDGGVVRVLVDSRAATRRNA
jgi:hypothetical protein